MNSKKVLSVLLIIAILFTFSPSKTVFAKGEDKFKSLLESPVVYSAYSYTDLSGKQKNQKEFREELNKKYVVVKLSGQELKAEEWKKDKNKLELKYQKELLTSVATDDQVWLYGQIYVPSGLSDLLNNPRLDVSKIDVNPLFDFVEGNNYLYKEPVGELAEVVVVNNEQDKVVALIPKAFKTVEKVEVKNETPVYGYYLNAVEPIDQKQSEMLYYFYFSRNYVRLNTKNSISGTKYDEKIEKLLVENILQIKEGKSLLKLLSGEAIKISKVERNSGEKVYYYANVISLTEDYDLKMVFIPKNGGIVCVLYIYYDQSDKLHQEQVNYIIESLSK